MIFFIFSRWLLQTFQEVSGLGSWLITNFIWYELKFQGFSIWIPELRDQNQHLITPGRSVWVKFCPDPDRFIICTSTLAQRPSFRSSISKYNLIYWTNHLEKQKIEFFLITRGLLDDLNQPEVEGIYETQMSLEFRAILNLGCMCKVRDCRDLPNTDTFHLDDLEMKHGNYLRNVRILNIFFFFKLEIYENNVPLIFINFKRRMCWSTFSCINTGHQITKGLFGVFL